MQSDCSTTRVQTDEMVVSRIRELGGKTQLDFGERCADSADTRQPTNKEAL